MGPSLRDHEWQSARRSSYYYGESGGASGGFTRDAIAIQCEQTSMRRASTRHHRASERDPDGVGVR
jgi:hypothetical protein